MGWRGWLATVLLPGGVGLAVVNWPGMPGVVIAFVAVAALFLVPALVVDEVRYGGRRRGAGPT